MARVYSAPGYTPGPLPRPTVTLLDLRNALVSHFCTHDIFRASQIDHLTVPKALAARKVELAHAALGQLVEMGMVKQVGEGTSALWILSAPLNAAGQDVHVSMQVANMVADTINTYFMANKIEGQTVDALQIHEGHIIMLLDILGNILSMDPDDPDREPGRGGSGGEDTGNGGLGGS